MRALLAKADVSVAEGILRTIKTAGIIVDYTSCGEGAVEMIRHHDYDVLLLGIELFDLNETDVVRKIRNSGQTIPIIMLAGEASTQATVLAFNAGADDVVREPIDQEEIILRIKAIVRRSKSYVSSNIHVGSLSLNVKSRQASVDGHVVGLTDKEFSILELLVMRKGVVLTKDAFLNHLYGGIDEPEGKIVDVFICKLRKKLKAAGADNLIETVWARGYMLRQLDAVLASTASFDEPVSEFGLTH